ncbi:unnamed protein product [Linum trigynum]|uniref:Transmembrane protein n=1 Tax=Linum trigynum TaxID=586398 RepID=A0AAV2D7F9_9ROSI
MSSWCALLDGSAFFFFFFFVLMLWWYLHCVDFACLAPFWVWNSGGELRAVSVVLAGLFSAFECLWFEASRVLSDNRLVAVSGWLTLKWELDTVCFLVGLVVTAYPFWFACELAVSLGERFSFSAVCFCDCFLQSVSIFLFLLFRLLTFDGFGGQEWP